MTLPLLLIAGTLSAQAGYKLLQNDDFVSGDSAAFQGGFIDGECWGVVYIPDPGDYPFDWVGIDTLVGGTGGTEAFDINFYELNNADLSTADLVANSYIAITGSNSAFNRIDLTDPKLEVTLPAVESGNVAVSICLSGFDGYPSIARDVGGMDYASRNWIYASGYGWYQSNMFGLTGDWIQRLCIETDAVAGDECDADTDADTDSDTDADTDADTDTDTDADTDADDTAAADLALDSITPASTNQGEPVDLVLLGSGFEAGIDASIGGISITGLDVVNDQTLQGRSPSALPVGVHDVEVSYDNGENAYLAAAFTVNQPGDTSPDEPGGCGCSAGSLSGALGLAWVGVFAVWARRRE